MEEKRKNLEGVAIGNGCPTISHLFFANDSLIFCKANAKRGMAVKEMLMLYEKASRQVVNVEKSGLFFSRNMKEEVMNNFEKESGIKRGNFQQKYLGLPSMGSRSWEKMFDFIKQRVGMVVQRWQEYLFSIGGKEVLKCCGTQAIPTYAMSCFRIPKGLCEEIHSMISRFWWGSGNNGKKIHWARWEEICKPKSMGGMGFRSMEDFNRALLAKQSWRILKDPESLMARIFKQKYFPKSSLWEADLKKRACQTWQSLLWGRDL